MKKILISCAAGLLMALSVAAAPGSKIIEQFKKTFPNAENVKWSETNNGYFVGFYQNGNFEKILYSKKGGFVRSWKYSDGKGLPTNIVMLLNKKVGDGVIKGVTETTTQNSTQYDIKMLKQNKLYCLNISADGTVNSEDVFDYEDASGTAKN
ncbi:hypothetical protein [Parafilimonas sp.]|uniref:hypothetical protein n=1 Tax=Parafilimonas sp. TaxID=1969739 RepID=UPI0039E24035